MIKLLITGLAVVFIYCGFIVMSDFNSYVVVNAYNYVVETSVIVAAGVLIFLVLITMVLLKIIYWVLRIPYFIRSKLVQSRERDINNILVHAVSNLLINNRHNISRNVKKLQPNPRSEQKEMIDLILAETEENFENKIQYYRSLTNSKNCSYFAIKRLAIIYYQSGIYEQAENYAAKAYDIDNKDIEILEILLTSYAALKKWNMFDNVISKLYKSHEKYLLTISKEIAELYIQAAKDTLEDGKDNLALNYIKYSLQFNPSDIKTLELYLSLNIVTNPKTNDNMQVIENAFSINPCFEIAEIYINTISQSANIDVMTVYNNLKSLVDNPMLYRSQFIAITALLHLPQETSNLVDTKLLTNITN